MIEQVEKWNPPSDDHVGLKTFMLSQLRQSLPNDQYYDEQLEEYTRTDPFEYGKKLVKESGNDIVYHEKKLRKEVERVENRNLWLQLLNKSVPHPNIK